MIFSAKQCSTAIFILFTLITPLLATGPVNEKTSEPAEVNQVTQKQIREDKTQPQYWISLAKTEMEAKNWLDAERHLKRAKRLDPKLAETYRLLGDIHSNFNRGWKAEKFYHKAAELEKQ